MLCLLCPTAGEGGLPLGSGAGMAPEECFDPLSRHVLILRDLPVGLAASPRALNPLELFDVARTALEGPVEVLLCSHVLLSCAGLSRLSSVCRRLPPAATTGSLQMCVPCGYGAPNRNPRSLDPTSPHSVRRADLQHHQDHTPDSTSVNRHSGTFSQIPSWASI